MNSINFIFNHWEEKTPNEPFLRQPFGDKWEVYSWKEAGQMARRLATGLQSLGLPPKSHIGLISKNCREWVIADIAIMMAGYVSVPLYPTLKASGIEELLDIGDVKAAFIGKIDDWEGMKTGIPTDIPIIKMPHYKGNAEIDMGEPWADFIAKYEELQGKTTFDPSDIWTIIFTSGTTGTPKGVVLSYGNYESTKVVVEKRNTVNISLTGDNRFFSFLPLNHIAERIVVEHTIVRYGGCISFAESLTTFAKNLQDTQPTFFFAVPRIWTKFQMGVLAKMPQKKLDLFLKIPILSGIVKKKLRAGLGMSNARGTLTGAAAIPESLKNWYRALGIPIVEGYGMTENSALCSTLEPDTIKPGSVGRALPDAEIKIDPDTGEIMMRAPYMMEGYYKDSVKTAEAIDNGWLRTGDQGRLDEDGYLYITGRIKDSFKTEKGQFIVPGPIERVFESNENIEQICLAGLGCPQPIALVVPSDIGKSKPKKELKSILDSVLAEANKSLPNYQKVSTLVIVKDIWDVGNNLLTPTLKVKRNQVNQRYQNLLMDWHRDENAVVWE